MSEQLQQALQSATPDILLTAFVELFNDQIDQYEKMEFELAVKRSENESLKEDIIKLTETIAQMDSDAKKLASACDRVVDMHEAQKKEMEKIRRQNEATQRQNELITAKANNLQKQLTAFKQIGDPQKMREQIKRLKAKGDEKDKDILRLKKINQVKEKQLDDAATQIAKLQIDLKKRDGKGEVDQGGQYRVYCDGDHSLIQWIQPVNADVNNEGKQIVGKAALMYVHRSGTGRMLLHDFENNRAVVARPPAGGVKIPKAMIEFADSWLYRVNVIQGGEVRRADLDMVNLNE